MIVLSSILDSSGLASVHQGKSLAHSLAPVISNIKLGATVKDVHGQAELQSQLHARQCKRSPIYQSSLRPGPASCAACGSAQAQSSLVHLCSHRFKASIAVRCG